MYTVTRLLFCLLFFIAVCAGSPAMAQEKEEKKKDTAAGTTAYSFDASIGYRHANINSNRAKVGEYDFSFTRLSNQC